MEQTIVQTITLTTEKHMLRVKSNYPVDGGGIPPVESAQNGARAAKS